MTIETNSFETTFISDHFIWDHDHLGPRSFETTFLWDLFIWDHIHMRLFSFGTTFSRDHIHLRSHSLYVTLK